MEKPTIGIIISTIRKGRFGDRPARWIFDVASWRDDLDFEIVDLRDYPLPLFGEDGSSRSGVAKRWSRKLDGYIFVTAEYNHSVPGILKNALDHAYPEFNRKPAAFVGYGGVGGVGGARAVEQLRLICVELQMAPTRNAVHIGMEPLIGVKREGRNLSDFDFLNRSAVAMLDELAWWTHTLKAGRDRETEAARSVGARR